MKRHRILMLASALCLEVFGVFQVVRAITAVRDGELADVDRFVHAYYAGAGQERYHQLFEESFIWRVRYASLRVSHQVAVGAGAIVAGLLILAVLGDTRPKERNPEPPASESSS
ncbi:MAG: hypothetical protein JXR37_11350 [Kiritimatiellae bacterium]|nr:hypothetical protein [Kiritimatiellia bacterium]